MSTLLMSRVLHVHPIPLFVQSIHGASSRVLNVGVACSHSKAGCVSHNVAMSVVMVNISMIGHHWPGQLHSVSYFVNFIILLLNTFMKINL